VPSDLFPVRSVPRATRRPSDRCPSGRAPGRAGAVRPRVRTAPGQVRALTAVGAVRARTR